MKEILNPLMSMIRGERNQATSDEGRGIKIKLSEVAKNNTIPT